MMDGKRNDIFHSYLGNVVLRNTILQDSISQIMSVYYYVTTDISINSFTNSSINILQEVLWNEEISKFPRNFF